MSLLNQKASCFLRGFELDRGKITDWNCFPFDLPAISRLEALEFHPQVTFLVGENGSGKSTLLEAVASLAGMNVEGGTKNFRGAQRSSDSMLDAYSRLVRGVRRESSSFFLRAETMFNVATEAEDYWKGTRLHEMSHGESFLWLATHYFRGQGLYLLDEPEAALSPQRQLAFLTRLNQLVDEGCQFIISTHSPLLMAFPRARIYQLGESGIEEVQYECTEHYEVTRAFVSDPERILAQLFREGEADVDEKDAGT